MEVKGDSTDLQIRDQVRELDASRLRHTPPSPNPGPAPNPRALDPVVHPTTDRTLP
jgi:hypothetical protein